MDTDVSSCKAVDNVLCCHNMDAIVTHHNIVLTFMWRAFFFFLRVLFFLGSYACHVCHIKSRRQLPRLCFPFSLIMLCVLTHQIPEFDNFYLDMNGIIHACSHPNDDDPTFRITEDKIFNEIFTYLEVCRYCIVY